MKQVFLCRFWPLAFIALFTPLAHAQFVWPNPEYNKPEPGLYKEDPFIVKYRKKFFAVLRGDSPTFQKAYAEIEAILKKNPNDARALVWLGTGKTIKAGFLLMKADRAGALGLLADSRKDLDRAVSLRPKDPNIYMMRATTLYIQGQYWPAGAIPRRNWETLRDDCLRFIAYVGPHRIKRASIHLRGEAYGELGVAYTKLGDKAKAIAAFQKVVEICPGTDYETRAKAEIAKLRG